MAAWASPISSLLCTVVLFTCLETAQTQIDVCNRPKTCQDDDVWPDPTDCRKYWGCNPGGRWRRQNCPRNQYFDSVRLECLREADATCASRCKPTLYCNKPTPCQQGDKLPEPGDCEKYHQCTGGRWRERSCNRAQHFDSLDLECKDEKDAVCAPACEPGPLGRTDPCDDLPEPCDEASAEMNTRDCSSYFICQSGTWEKVVCEDSKKYDQDRQQCIPADESTCEETCTLIDEPPELPDFPSLPDARSNPPAITPVAPLTGILNETVIDLVCNNLECPTLIKLPNPLDCSKYTECQYGFRGDQACDPGHRFDVRTMQCQGNNEQVTCMPACETFDQTTQSGNNYPDPNEPSVTEANLPESTPDTDDTGTPTRSFIQRLLAQACNIPVSRICVGLLDLPVPGNCSAYYSCETVLIRPTYTIRVCPAGELFDIKSQRCKPSDAAYCMRLQCSQDSSTQPSDGRTTPDGNPKPPMPGITVLQTDIPQATTLPPAVVNVTVPQVTRGTVTVSPITKVTRVTVRPTKPVMCKPSVDGSGLRWKSVTVGEEVQLPCPSSSRGNIIRRCIVGAQDLPVWEDPVSFCVDPQYSDILDLAQGIVAGPNQTSMQLTNQVSQVSQTLRKIILTEVAMNKELSAGNLNASVEAVLALSDVNIFGVGADPNTAEIALTNVGLALDELISPNNSKAWKKILMKQENSGVKAMNAANNVGGGVASTLPKGLSKKMSFQNFAIQTVSLPENTTTAISFNVDISQGAPLLQLNYSSTDSSAVLDSIEVQPETLRVMAENAGTDDLKMWATYHSRLEMLMPATENMIINSRILALTVKNLKTGFTFQPPITLRFKPLNKSLVINETFCSYWKYTSMTSGYWSQDGCTLKSNTTDLTTCECDHLTNFAVLVSPYLADGKHARILSLISLIGCLLSILGYFATMVFYMLAWKEVKSQHAIVLLNLCAVLIIANIIFLVGIDKVQLEDVCTAVAALLHYFWLVAFMVMLADGVMFILYVVYVFHVKRRRETVLLLVTAYVVPAIIVGVTLGVTQTKGYGTNEYCWLERTSGLIAAFIAPVAVIIFANFIVLIKVLHTAATSKSNEHKNRSRVAAVIWNIMVVLPLLGIAWIFGLLSVNEQTIAFQYVFAIANSLQGLFIFLFHCLLNKKLRNGVSARFSFKGSTTSSLKSNKSANLRQAANKKQNGILNDKRTQEEKVL